ncbi:MAG: glycosyltransferase family 4 protein [Acidobacteria bacterium]|nr:glycosyltransferase family 4 protein [Acidobacteriota bacterium]
MRLAFVSPLPPAPTGVADYAAGLLAELRRHAQVDVLTEARAGYDNALYHLGNNPLHLPAYRAALAEPGVAVLHDAVLHHFLLGTLDERAYIEEFVYNYGEWMRDLGRELWRSRSRSSSDRRYFQYPLLRRVVDRSRAVVVHNPGARRIVEAVVPGKQVAEIPHYFISRALPGEAPRTRERLGIGAEEIVIGTFGYLRDSMRMRSILKALPAVPRARFLLVGEFVSADLERSLAPLLAACGVIRTGHVSEDEFWRLAEITDIVVNLRDPSAGETSGIGIKMMGIGKPVLVTAGEETAAFPELAVIRIDPGEAEVEMLAEYLRALAGSEEMRREIGRRAAQHIAENHTLERAAKMYLDLVAETTIHNFR